MQLDKLDTKILATLERDSSISITSLAKIVKRSKETVHYRLERLKEQDILRSCTAVVDIAKLGYLTFRIYIRWQNMTLSIKEQFYKEIGENKNVWTTTELHGKWDFAFFLGIKRDEYITKFHNTWNALLAKYKPYIAEHKIAIYAPIHNYNKRFFTDEKTIISRITGEDAVIEHDEIDEQIILAYAPDVRQSLSAVARTVGTSIETVRRRIHDLEEKKVIVGYKIDINLAKLGFQGYRVDFALNTTQKNMEIYEYLKQHKYFYQINKSIGGADIETEVVVRDLAHLLELLEEIMRVFRGVIKSYEYMGYSDFPKLSIVPD
ncbi:TPA: Lrp/AsnC family transcriptional regulator [Candidatus Woesearchaeota archaeon]|nr:Lrp/AsnC family transcriptional regulator [Candidatus Woesearchaeota archaeon]